MDIYRAGQIIKDCVSFEDAAARYGLQFNRAGFALCPFHSEDTPSFKVHNNRGHCFGCGWQGDVIAFVRDLNGDSFSDAVQRLARDFAVPVYLDRKPTLREHRDARQKYRQITAENAKRKAEKEAYERRYDTLWRIWCTLDRWRHDYAPKSPDEPLNRLYVYAVKKIDYISYRIDTEL